MAFGNLALVVLFAAGRQGFVGRRWQVMAEQYWDIAVDRQSGAPLDRFLVKELKAVAAAFVGLGSALPFAADRSGFADRHWQGTAAQYWDIAVGCQLEASLDQIPVVGLKAVAAAFAGQGPALPFAAVPPGLVGRR